MPIRFKIDILAALKEKGYTPTVIRSNKIFGEATLQQFRKGKVTNSIETLSKLCELLECQPSDILEYIPE